MSNSPNPQPLVSIITATFNAEKVLRHCLASVRAQDYPAIQHILIDGGSSDGTVDMLKEQADEGSWISERDKGIYDAWNKGLRMARGEWICFLGADDQLLPGAISAYMRLAANNPQAQYLSSKVRWISPTGRKRSIGGPWTWPRFQRFMCTAHPASMHHRDLFAQYGNYDDTLRIVGDYEFLLRSGPSLRAAFMPQVTVEMQGGGTSDSLRALDEAKYVKVNTADRKPWIASLERRVARLGFRFRRAFLR